MANILIADDDQNDLFFLTRAFRKSGLDHALFTVGDGEQAVDYLRGDPPYGERSRYPVPDLMLLDLKMPRVNGFEVLEWLRTRPDYFALPVVVLSSSADPSDVAKAQHLGAKDYKVKPSDFNVLVDVVRELAIKWLSGRAGQLRAAPIGLPIHIIPPPPKA